MKLHLGGSLAFFGPDKKELLEVPLNAPCPLKEVLASLGIPVSEVYLTVVDGEQVRLSAAIVTDASIVHLYPPLDGG